jgi:hypothetical protein
MPIKIQYPYYNHESKYIHANCSKELYLNIKLTKLMDIFNYVTD